MNYIDLMRRHLTQAHHDNWSDEKIVDLVMGGRAYVMDLGEGKMQLVIHLEHPCTDHCYKVVD